MKIGVISDTHGYFDPQISELFAGVDHILHAGDVGTSKVVFDLEQIAPVTAVLGNVDAGLHFRDTEVVELDSKKFLLHHIVEPQALDQTLQRRITREQPDVVVFGHTHKPFCETINGIMFLNPGYTGKQRFALPRSLAILHLDGPRIRAEHLFL